MSEYEVRGAVITRSEGPAAGTESRQSAPRPRFSLPERLGWAGGWAALLLLAAWMQQLSLLWLGLALLGVLAWNMSWNRGGRGWWLGVTVALWTAWIAAGVVQLRLQQVGRDWTATQATIEESAATALRRALDELVDRGERAADGAAQALAGGESTPQLGPLFSRLAALRGATGVSALAVYEPDGTPLAWAGEHRGALPDPVRHGDRGYMLHEGPLFRYLYFARPLEGDRTAVAAILLESSIPIHQGNVPFANRFAAQHGVTPRFTAPERARGDAVWDWTLEYPILSVSFAALTQDRWRARLAERGRWVVGSAWLAALLLLGVGWYRQRQGAPGVPVAIATLSLLLIPIGAIAGTEGLFSPLGFVLPMPGDLTLGELLILLLGSAIWLLTRPVPPTVVARFPLALRAALAALVIPLALALISRSAAEGLLASEPAGGIALVLASSLLIALPLLLLLGRTRDSVAGRTATLPAIAGFSLAAALGIGLVVGWHPRLELSPWIGALWAVPFLLLATAFARSRYGALFAWLMAGWIAGTVALSFLWTLHMEARLEQAEAELAQLGTEVDPYLDFLLRQFAEHTVAFAADGESGVNLLYQSWMSSGLAREGYEVRITSWHGEVPTAELRLSPLQLPAEMVPEMIARAHGVGEPVLERYTQLDALHYLLLVPLPEDRVISVAVPPRRRLGGATALARFLHPGADLGAEQDYESLTLIPVPGGGDMLATPHDPLLHLAGIRWVETRTGWRSETTVTFPAGPMHAHLVIRTPSVFLLLVRALLVQVLLLAVFTLLWSLARSLCGEPLGFPASFWQWLRSFRGRITLALFGFFLAPTLAFGAVAYTTLAQEVVRTTAMLAMHSLQLASRDAAIAPLEEVGDRVQADLLLYRWGALVAASAPEVLDLGLFRSWLPPDVHLAFAGGEDTEAAEERQVAGNRYLAGYRRLDAAQVLGAPIPLAAGEISRRQREFADLVLLITLIGAALSVLLALRVGRTLSRPIEQLSRAAAAVGSGNLRLRLPEHRTDEFGRVFHSFNRMVRRLRRARAAEVRTARILAWGEMARQVAHEIKNPLTPIKLSVQHLRRAHGDGRKDFGEILDRNVEAILREIDRLSEIARAFARFGAPAQPAGSLEPVDVGAIVEETLVLYRGSRDGIEYRLDVDPAVPPALARVGELKEVLVNLLENAREALNGSGEIRITAAPAGGGGWVKLAVSDTGEGMAPEVLQRVFEPQFSTRTSGTGLGLAIVRRLVEAWGGEVSAESEPGSGTTVHLRLQAADGRVN